MEFSAWYTQGCWISYMVAQGSQSVSRIITALLGPELGNWYRITSFPGQSKFAD